MQHFHHRNGKPLFLSESLYVVNYYTYLQKESELKDVVSTLHPVGYYEDERLQELAKWFYALEKNLSDNWINKPKDITELLVNSGELKAGLRPYRLETRYWSPSDNYKVEEAYEAIEEAKKKLAGFYEEVKKRY